MQSVLYLGQDPDTVDFSDPALPPGVTADMIKAGIAAAKTGLEARGWQTSLCMIAPDESGLAMLETALASADYDCVVVGAGLRQPPKTLPLFEKVVNTIHKGAPRAAIAFNTRPDDTADAAGRWIAGA